MQFQRSALSETALTGRSAEHVGDIEPSAGRRGAVLQVHRGVFEPLGLMRAAAAEDGIELLPLSAFRSFDRQLRLWNDKFRGRRPLLDAHGAPLRACDLDPAARVEAILIWSALPGASRHHWGTDLDFVDGRILDEGYAAQLTAAEFEPRGPFASVGAWLEQHAEGFGFFRPFRGEASGVAAEPWHWSYAPLAEPAREALTSKVLQRALSAADIEGKAELLAQLDRLHQRYVARIDAPRTIAGPWV